MKKILFCVGGGGGAAFSESFLFLRALQNLLLRASIVQLHTSETPMRLNPRNSNLARPHEVCTGAVGLRGFRAIKGFWAIRGLKAFYFLRVLGAKRLNRPWSPETPQAQNAPKQP